MHVYRTSANVPTLLFALIPCLAAQQSRAVLEGRSIKIEATVEEGALREKYYGRAGSAWIELATHTAAPPLRSPRTAKRLPKI
jgi:hypothetical protein